MLKRAGNFSFHQSLSSVNHAGRGRLAKAPFKVSLASFHPSLAERKQATASARALALAADVDARAESSSSTSSFASPAAFRLPSNRAKNCPDQPLNLRPV